VGAEIKPQPRKIVINENQLRQFLLRTAQQVPPPAAAGKKGKAAPPQKTRVAGSRAGVGSDLIGTLYWKR